MIILTPEIKIYGELNSWSSLRMYCMCSLEITEHERFIWIIDYPVWNKKQLTGYEHLYCVLIIVTIFMFLFYIELIKWLISLNIQFVRILVVLWKQHWFLSEIIIHECILSSIVQSLRMLLFVRDVTSVVLHTRESRIHFIRFNCFWILTTYWQIVWNTELLYWGMSLFCSWDWCSLFRNLLLLVSEWWYSII